jgi:hypothetical protein
MPSSIARIVVAAVTLTVGSVCADAEFTAETAIERLARDPVTRLEWGLDRLRRSLLEIFAIDPLTLEPVSPPYFINAGYRPSDGYILVEIGRTLPSIGTNEAKTLCAEYIARVRGFLSVGKGGRPAVNGISDLAAEYFHPIEDEDSPDPDFAHALDQSVRLRALVAAPMSGVYSICTANLTDSPIRHIE